MTTGEENSGVRFNKYKLGVTTDVANYQAVDWSLYRLTWVYFAKAEALMRKNNGVATQEVVDLINACKKRSFSASDWITEAYTTATLTMDELLKERGRELSLKVLDARILFVLINSLPLPGGIIRQAMIKQKNCYPYRTGK